MIDSYIYIIDDLVFFFIHIRKNTSLRNENGATIFLLSLRVGDMFEM